MKNRLREELEAMLELRTGDSFTADNVHTLVNGIFAADEGGGFVFVEYDNNAFPYPQEIGKTAPSISGLGPADETMIKTIFIMPNKSTNPDATLMIVVDEVDPPTNPKTYQYVYVGNINDLPSDVLTESSIVNDLSTGGTDKPLSAEQGKTLNSHVNYTTCGSGASDEVKLISDDGFELSTHLRLLVMMTNTNTHATPKFNINDTGIKDVWYNGSIASDTNTWSAGEVLDVYYDGGKYVANTHGGAQFSTGEKVGDVGIDNEPTANSNNLVKSGGVYEKVSQLSQEVLTKRYQLLTGNLIWTDGKFIFPNGGIGISSSTMCTEDYYPVKAGDIIFCHIYASGAQESIVVYDANKENPTPYSGRDITINVVADGYIRFSQTKAPYYSANYIPSPYVKVQGYDNINELSEVKYFTIHVAPTDAGDNSLVNVLHRLQSDETKDRPSAYRRYTIELEAGEYNIDSSDLGRTELRRYMTLKGAGINDTILKFYYAGSDDNVKSNYSGLDLKFNGIVISDLTIDVKNVRYAIHGLPSASEGRIEFILNNVKLIHRGFEDGVTATYKAPNAWASGSVKNFHAIFNGCIFESYQQNAFFDHNQVASNSSAGASVFEFNNCEFISHSALTNLSAEPYATIVLNSIGSTAVNQVYLNNCKMNKHILLLPQNNSKSVYKIISDGNEVVYNSLPADDWNYIGAGCKVFTFAQAATKGSPVQLLDVKNAKVYDGAGVTNIIGILLNDVSAGGEGIVMTKGIIPMQQILGTTFNQGTPIGWDMNNNTWVNTKNNPLLVAIDRACAKVGDIPIDLTDVFEFNESMSQFFDEELNTSPSNLKQGLLRANTGLPYYTEAEGSYPNYRYTPEYFKVTPGGKLSVKAKSFGSFAGICYYNANYAFVSSVQTSMNTSPQDFIVPQGVSYVRFCSEVYTQYGMYAKRYAASLLPGISELYDAVDPNVSKKYFVHDSDLIPSNPALDFNPKNRKVDLRYPGQVDAEKRFVAIGFDDFRDSDFSVIQPIFEKYGFTATFNRIAQESVSNSDKQKVNSTLYGGHELGDHTFMHYKFPYDEPMFNGQDPSNPDGNQIPYPSNDDMRTDRGDGKNAFGIDLTTTIATTYSNSSWRPPVTGTTTWGNLTDSDCQSIRNYFSLMKDTSSNLISLLDNLSNKYLGTTGSSSGSWDNTDGEYKGGIFTGCKTSANHEVWERIMILMDIYYKQEFGLNYNIKCWSLPGSKSSYCYYELDGKKYYDPEHTKYVNCLAKMTSSLYQNEDGTYKSRSWADVLREFGYLYTHDSDFPSRRDGQSNPMMSKQFIINADTCRPDGIVYPTNRSISYSTISTAYPETFFTGTKKKEVQMYEGEGAFYTCLNSIRHNCAHGMVHGEVIDSLDTYSERIFFDRLLYFCRKTGVEVITKAEAYDICFNHRVVNGNLLYNPDLRNSISEFMPEASNVPTNPDGYSGNCRVDYDENNVPILVSSGTGTDFCRYLHFGIPIGTIKYSAEVKGDGYIRVYIIKNKTDETSLVDGYSIHDESISSESFTHLEFTFDIKDNAMISYNQRCEGYDEKIMGIAITYKNGVQVKNIRLEKIK